MTVALAVLLLVSYVRWMHRNYPGDGGGSDEAY